MKFSLPTRQMSGVGIVAAVYIYFLIFAEFAFLRLAQAQGLSAPQVRFVMGCMGVAGIAGSLWTARAFGESKARRMLLLGWAGCAAAAVLALGARSSAVFAVAAGLIGGFLGLLTVSLIGNLPRFFLANHRGALIGLGTGLAYAVCNVPAVFGGSAVRQTVVAIVGCAAGATLTFLARFPDHRPVPSPPVAIRGAGTFPALGPLVIIFLVLIWLDSAAFYILQNTPVLNQFGWANRTLQWKNAGIHFAVAVLAGLWLDRGGLSRVLQLAFVCLAGAAICVSARTPAAQLTHWLYAAGVSLYSTALVFTPFVGADAMQAKKSIARAGILYSVAGWAGSALGIGMAQDLHLIPLWFVGLAATVVACCWGWQAGKTRRDSVHRIAAVAGTAALVFVVGRTSSARLHLQPAPNDTRSLNELGREVYISEGCMSCHSQYVRPGTSDEVPWGPVANPEQVRQEQPPLIGNRRQGPDLMNVGNRRSPLWNRIHLVDPRALTPQSRMPSYAPLFAVGDARGQALLAYLAELGADTGEQRNDIRQRWQPDATTIPISRAAQATLFQQSCSQCHGSNGAGGGFLTDQLGPRKPRDLTHAQWQFIPRRNSQTERRLEIARVIKFGVSGTSMAGHEYFSDEKVLGLAEYVVSLAATKSTQ